MDFAPTPQSADHAKLMRAFLDEEVLPAETGYVAWRGAGADGVPPVVEELKASARERGL